MDEWTDGRIERHLALFVFLCLWEYGDIIGIWRYCDMDIFRYGGMEVWRCGDMEIRDMRYGIGDMV